MSCTHCGKCCSYVALEIRPQSVPWLELHGIPTAKEDGVHKLTIMAPCKWRDEETRRCTNYDERPAICRDYLCSKAKGE